MKNVLLVLAILFFTLTFAGAGYVLLSHGGVNAGFSIIPMVFALACTLGYKSMKKNKQQ